MTTNKSDRFPLNATFELTARCNLQCKMCLIRLDNKRMAELGGRERTTNEWLELAKEIKNEGALGLLLTGGEPMLRPDFAQIYREVAQMGFVLTLYTNATLVTPEIMKVLEEYPPHNIGVTIYGASYETYEKVTGHGNAYERMLEGVRVLRNLPSKLTIRTTIIKDNLEDVDQIIKFAMSLGEEVEFNISRIVTKQVRGGVADVASCRLTPEQNVWVQEKIKSNYIIDPIKKIFSEGFIETDKRNSLMDLVGRLEDKEPDVKYKVEPNLYGCSAGFDSFTITWDGKLIGCQLLGDCFTEPFLVGFKKAWDTYPDMIRLPGISEKCKDCSTACCACPATRLAETGSLGGWPDYICEEAKRKEEMYNRLFQEMKQIIIRKEDIYESI